LSATIPGGEGGDVPASRRPRTKKAVAPALLEAIPVSTARTGPANSPTGGRPRPAVATGWQPAVRANLVVEALGNRRTAELLGVSASQPSQWRHGKEVPGPEVAPLLVDLDHVVARLQLLWGDANVIAGWLGEANGFLDGARPIDVLRRHGSADVLAAIQAEMAGAYA
jgi:hypothetical protein